MNFPRNIKALLEKAGAASVEMPDDQSVVVYGLPVNAEFFSKPGTNLLLRKVPRDKSLCAGIDEDLLYTGNEPRLVHLFDCGVRMQGWRLLFMTHDAPGRLRIIVDQVLRLLGSAGDAPRADAVREQPRPKGNLMSSFGHSLTPPIQSGPECPAVLRKEMIADVTACLLRREANLPVVVGDSGVGKTHLLEAVAARLTELPGGLRLVAIDLGQLFAGALFPADREQMLTELFKEAEGEPGIVLMFEHIELLATDLPRGLLLLADTLDRGIHIIGSVLSSHLGVLLRPPLERRLQLIVIKEAGPDETVQILRTLARTMETHHGIGIAPNLLNAIVAAAMPLPGMFPGKAVSLFDACLARARLNENPAVIGLDDIYSVAAQMAAIVGDDEQQS